MSEVSDAISTNAQGPKKVVADGVAVEQHSLADQIAADKHLKGEGNKTRSGFFLRRQLARPPGAGPGS